MPAPTTGTIVQFVEGQIDRDLRDYAGQSRRARLGKLLSVWEQRRAAFIAHAMRPGPMPSIFYYGPHLGWITATDFLLIISAIDARRVQHAQVAA